MDTCTILIEGDVLYFYKLRQSIKQYVVTHVTPQRAHLQCQENGIPDGGVIVVQRYGTLRQSQTGENYHHYQGVGGYSSLISGYPWLLRRFEHQQKQDKALSLIDTLTGQVNEAMVPALNYLNNVLLQATHAMEEFVGIEANRKQQKS